MKNTITNLILALSLILSSCSDIEHSETLANQISFNNQYSSVISMATEAFRATTDNSRSTEALIVGEVLPWMTKDIYPDYCTNSRTNKHLPDTLLYIVNFKNESGYVIVSDNDYLKSVVAIVPNANLNPKDNIDNPGFKYYLELYKESLQNNIINKTFNLEDFADYISVKNPYEGSSSEWVTVTEYPNKLIQEWGQRAPYNRYCFTTDGEQALAGCLPIAFAQVLTYYEYPEIINGYKINWANTHFKYPRSIVEEEAAARLVHELGVLSDASYGTSTTSAKVLSMNNQLTKWGYTFRYNESATEYMMIHNLYEYGPALMYGASRNPSTGTYIGAHEWVIDGALAQRKVIDGKEQIRFLYHCNWGWNGNSNGYFLSGAFNPYGESNHTYKFNYNVKATYFIKKPQT